MVPLLTTLLPLAVQFVVPLIEKIFGGKKSPDDTQTGATKQANAVAILQQLAAALGHSGTDADYKAIVDAAVAVLNQSGVLPKAASVPAAGVTYTITGTIQAAK